MAQEDFLKELPAVEPYRTWVKDWCQIMTACWRQNGKSQPLEIAPPASEQAVSDVEAALGRAVPSELREMFLTFSRHLQFGWDWPNPIDLPGLSFPRLYGGIRLGLSVNALPDLQNCLLNEASLSPQEKARIEKEYPEILSLEARAFPFLEVGNGDCLIIDLQDHHVKYLAHDDPEATGIVLAQSFHHFMAQWSALGCVGPEIWFLEPFLDEHGLNAQGSLGQAFRAWIGLE